MDNVLKAYVAGAIVGLVGGGIVVGLPLGWKLNDQHTIIVKQQKFIKDIRNHSVRTTG
jgi:hypothetical protein